MEYLKIDKKNFKNKFLSLELNKYLYDNLKNEKTYIFDIHNTIEYDDNQIDKTIYNFIKDNYKKYNFIFLSYDGNDERIKYNNDILNNYSKILTKIPKIFIKKRKKHYIISYISKILKTKFKSNKEIFFIDDNYKNIIDAHKISNIVKNFNIIHYTKHTKRKSEEGIDDIKDIL